MKTLSKNTYEGIQWIKLFDSLKKWPTLGIGACTHWWETVWLEIMEFLERTVWIDKILTRWKLFFILINIPAYEHYLKTQDVMNSRFIEENLNRSCSEKNIKKSNSQEIKRIREIYPLLASLDIFLDIHSTYTPSESITIFTQKSYKLFHATLNTNVELIDLTKKQVWKPVIDITERNWWIWIGIETGCQFDKEWFKTWVDNILRVLKKLKMINWVWDLKQYILNQTPKKSIKITKTIIIKNGKFKSAKNFKHWDKVKKWDLIAFDWEQNIFTNKDCIILMPTPKKLQKKIIWEEFCFLGENLRPVSS